MEYTKGEWEYYEGIAAPAVIVKGNLGRPNKLICHARLFNGSEDLAEAQANAHLIAAAPEMYEAGLQLLVVMCELCRRLNPQHENCQSCEEIEGYRKAFAKAEGTDNATG